MVPSRAITGQADSIHDHFLSVAECLISPNTDCLYISLKDFCDFQESQKDEILGTTFIQQLFIPLNSQKPDSISNETGEASLSPIK